MYVRYLNFAFFENRHHPSISLALELYSVTVHSQIAAWMSSLDGTLSALAPILGLEICPWNVPADMH